LPDFSTYLFVVSVVSIKSLFHPLLAMDEALYKIITHMDESNFGIQNKILFFKELGFLLKGGV
jgi:hypothetical protein